MSNPPENKSNDADPLKQRGDPLEGLWHWTDQPLARVGITLAVLVGSVLGFILLAQLTF